MTPSLQVKNVCEPLVLGVQACKRTTHKNTKYKNTSMPSLTPFSVCQFLILGTLCMISVPALVMSAYAVAKIYHPNEPIPPTSHASCMLYVLQTGYEGTVNVDVYREHIASVLSVPISSVGSDVMFRTSVGWVLSWVACGRSASECANPALAWTKLTNITVDPHTYSKAGGVCLA